jgi:hypothetical protein
VSHDRNLCTNRAQAREQEWQPSFYPSEVRSALSWKAPITFSRMVVTPCAQTRQLLFAYQNLMPLPDGNLEYYGSPPDLTHESLMSSVHSTCAQFFLDTHELVVFLHPLATAGSAGLEMTGGHGHGEIGDETVHRLA